MRAAEHGDRAALLAAVSTGNRRGSLSNGEAAAIARAVAERELRTLPPVDTLSRVREVRPCAYELDDVLADRMRTHDATGAEAALARIEGRGLSPGDARHFAGDPDASWHAVGARGLVRSEDRVDRLRALLDPDPRVRRQAARAAHDAADEGDLAALAEAARLDPEPIVRTEAVRAIAVLPPIPRTAIMLHDLWNGGDDGLREDIARAWSTPSLWSAGGREALRVLIAAEHGPGAIEGAAAVLRRRETDAEMAQAAAALLVRTIQSGSRRERLQALAQTPLDRNELVASVKTAAGDDDAEVRVAALARLAPYDGARVRELEALARPGSRVGARARFALAAIGDRRVQAWIEQDLASSVPEDRLGAATALATMGVAARAAALLADADSSVRLRAACTMLMAARTARVVQ
jgi:HEAT repeat protein